MNKVLLKSRLFVAWMAVGVAVGIYDNSIKYADSRVQFGRKITGFQLNQEKIVRMMGHV